MNCDTQHNDIKYNVIQHNNKRNVTFSITAEGCYADCHKKPYIVIVIMLDVVMLSVVAPLNRPVLTIIIWVH